jgi:GMP synthase (glutamine-hydrolysing)
MKPLLALRHVEHESLGTLAPILARSGLACQTVDWFAPGQHSFTPGDVAGLVVMGGPMNVDETGKYPFLATEARWIGQAVQAELPVLGICLGSQLLAKTLGAGVYPNRVKEIGWYPIELTAAAADDRLFGGCGPSATVFQWHGDTFDLPSGAVHLARSPLCQHQAFRYGRSAYGLQFHLEITAEMIADWLVEPGNCGELSGLPAIDPQEILRRTPREMPGLTRLAEDVFSRFAALCRERAGE